MLESVDPHEIVGSKMNPACPEDFLAPGPETLPAAAVHSLHQSKSKALEPIQDGELFRFRNQSNVQCPMSNVCLPRGRVVHRGDLWFRTLDFRHWTLDLL